MNIKPNQKSRKNLIYKCSVCGNLHTMISGEMAHHCNICKKKNTKQLWLETNKELATITKNISKMVEDKKTLSDKISDKITLFCGNIYFVYLHIIWFATWLIYNTMSENAFDPYPFGMLTLVVSLEAIILATFILISQNRQGEITNLRSEADFQTDLKAEKKVVEILSILKSVYKDCNKK